MTGRSVGRFEILEKLGEGGMGEVWKARDTRLGRFVALKILPPEKIASPTRKQRFIQEAKTASALNHPNIVTIYEIGSAEGADYIAMELLVGRTLQDVLARRRLKTAETLKYAVQIADALAAAHAAGIIHRDLKPANVMIAESGLVKVLDFGLAKLTDESEVSEDDVTRTERALTEDGVAVGSAPYMSPEQAEGKKVDARSDIFSFGLVLYEMLSGKQAFRAETRMKTMIAVLNQEPTPLAEAAPGLPKELERIVARCLRKELARRSQSMAEIKIALEELKEESDSGVGAPSGSGAAAAKKPGARWHWWAFGGAAAALCAAVAILPPRGGSAQMQEIPLTSYNGSQGQPALSPDGSQFAFVWDGGQENTPRQLYVSLVGRGTPLKLTNTPGAGAAYPSWSPDGQTIAYLRTIPGKNTADLMLIPALGGPERRIGEASVGASAWSPDGKWLYFVAPISATTGALFVESSIGGERRKLTDPPPSANGDYSPSVSPDGKQLVFVRRLADINWDLMVADLRDGATAGPPRRLNTDRRNKVSPVWTNDGNEIVYITNELSGLAAVYRVRASGGTPRRVGIGGDYAATLAIAPRGHRLVYSRAFRDYNMYRMKLLADGGTAGTSEKFLSSTRYEGQPAYSLDGRRVAFSSSRSGLWQIWVADADGSNPVALTNLTAGVTGSPRWSPDGRTIVFDARPEGLSDIYSIGAEGGSLKRLTDNPAEDHIPCYSADGRWIFFASLRSGQRQLYRIPANGGEAVQITHKGAFASMASPDGKWIYYTKLGTGIWSLWKVPPDGGEEAPVAEIPRVFYAFAFWVTPTGIYYAAPRDPVSRNIPLRLYRFADGKTVELGHIDKPLYLNISVSPDEKWIAWAQLDSSVDDLMLVENFR